MLPLETRYYTPVLDLYRRRLAALDIAIVHRALIQPDRQHLDRRAVGVGVAAQMRLAHAEDGAANGSVRVVPPIVLAACTDWPAMFRASRYHERIVQRHAPPPTAADAARAKLQPLAAIAAPAPAAASSARGSVAGGSAGASSDGDDDNDEEMRQGSM